MTYEAITDRTNPFNVDGISDEDKALLDYVLAERAGGLDLVVTCTTDHPVRANSGRLSRHRWPGTNGVGLAIDARRRTRGNDIHQAVFDAFLPVEHQLAELIYAGAAYNIKAGRQVPPYAVADHHDHVHIAVDKGVLLRHPAAPAPSPTPTPPSGDDVPKDTDFTSAAFDPVSGGFWMQTYEGGIDGHDGAVVTSTYRDHPELGYGSHQRRFLALAADGKGGVAQIANDGSRYHWPKP